MNHSPTTDFDLAPKPALYYTVANSENHWEAEMSQFPSGSPPESDPMVHQVNMKPHIDQRHENWLPIRAAF